jgi:hypothetical protein
MLLSEKSRLTRLVGRTGRGPSSALADRLKYLKGDTAHSSVKVMEGEVVIGQSAGAAAHAPPYCPHIASSFKFQISRFRAAPSTEVVSTAGKQDDKQQILLLSATNHIIQCTQPCTHFMLVGNSPMPPVSPVLLSCTYCKLRAFASDAGTLPPRLGRPSLYWSLANNSCRELSAEKSGKGPDSALSERYRCSRFLGWVKQAGMEPCIGEMDKTQHTSYAVRKVVLIVRGTGAAGSWAG